ncbi:DNA-formamidopyrimidine glycosylase family protein [Epilithonimonas sp.]|uniref:DNA-formamidopyrimidine glycosylase family protein n=1 Tax=Epilithonimonas sp. TaxID=2894511 RepID=UPI0028A2B546|nr:DNA-formamidopyrimidine glycosylase family protein [Epilithonimonas sp.]
MPEGPVIVLMKEDIQKFVGEKVIAVGGSEIEEKILLGKSLKEIRLYGKQTYLVFDEINVRIHLLMFGSYEIDEQTKPDSNLRLGLSFKNGKAFFYTCSVKLLPYDFMKTIDWEADVMSDIWNSEKAKNKLISNPKMMVCDALMNQDIFSGVGNIIKNEALFRIAVQPESLLGNLPSEKLDDLIAEARNFSFDFYKWKRSGVLRKKFQVYEQKNCPFCGKPLTKKITGKSKRASFFCETDQKLY